MKPKTILHVILGGTCAAFVLGCETKKEQRMVSVNGSASADYSADQVDVALTIETKGGTAPAAMDANKSSLNAVMKIIDDGSAFIKNIQKNTTQFGEKSTWVDGQKRREGYNASTRVSFVAKDIPKYDSISRLFADILGVSIYRSDLSLSNEIEMRGAVRKIALKKAEEKAALMADCLGMKIGKPIKIAEANGYRSPMGPSGVMMNSVAEAVDNPSSGIISVDASIDVEFEMTSK